MKNYTILTALFLFCGCAYQSVIVKPKKNGTSIVYINQLPEQNAKPAPNSILSNPIDLIQFEKLSNKPAKGNFYIFMSNSQYFIEARSIISSSDTIILSGTIADKIKMDSLPFTISFNSKEIAYNLSKNLFDSYSIDLFLNKDFQMIKDSADFGHRGGLSEPEKLSFRIEKSQNFIIEEGVLELITGQIKYNDDKPFKYIVINDPEEFSVYLKAVCIILTINIDNYSKECNEKYKNCPNGYKAKYNWNLWHLAKDIYCECKK